LSSRRFDPARALRLDGWEGFLAAAILFGLLIAFVFPEAALQGKVFRTPDSLAPSGLAQYLEDEDLEAPLWNPFIFSGMPAFASLSYHPGLYPASTLLRLLIDLLHLPPLTWLLFHYLWAALGLFCFLRWRGVRPWLAWLGGAFFILLPAQVAVGAYGHGSKVMTLSWIPWMLLFADRLMGKSSAESEGSPSVSSLTLDCSLLAASIAGLLLSAHVQVAYYGLLALGLFSILRLVMLFSRGLRARAIRALAAGLLALLLAAGASAILYAPVQEYSHHSIRGLSQGGGADWQYATAWSLHPSEWKTFVFPSAVGFGEETYFGRMPMTNYPNYLGPLAILAAAMLFIRPRRRRFDLFFLGLGLGATLVAGGQYLEFAYRPLYDWLPWFNRFRVPVMILILQQMAMAILLARGLQRVVEEERVRADFRLALGGGILVLLIAGIFAPTILEKTAMEGLSQRLGRQLSGLPPAQASAYLSAFAAKSVGWLRVESLRAALLLLPMLAVLELVRRGRKIALLPILAAATLVFLLGDLLPLDRRVLHPESHWDSHRGGGLWGMELAPQSDLPPKTLAFLEESLDDQRFFALPGSPFGGNRAAALGLANLGGYHAAKMALADSVIRSLGTGGAELLGRFAVKYIISPEQRNLGPDFPQIRAGGDSDSFLYENTHWRPRLFVEDRLQVEDEAASRRRLLEGKAASPLYLAEDPGFEPGAVADTCGRLIESDFGLDEVSCVVEMARPGVVVLADMDYPGWIGEIDGEERSLITADGFFRALSVEAGRHSLRFIFRPEGFRSLVWLRRGAFLVMAFLLVAGLAGLIRSGKEAPA